MLHLDGLTGWTCQMLVAVRTFIKFILKNTLKILSHQSKMLVLDKGLKPLVGTRFLLADFRTLA